MPVPADVLEELSEDLGIHPADLRGSLEEQQAAAPLYEQGDMSKLVKTYLDENVPTRIQQHEVYREFWAMLGHTVKLSFLTHRDIDVFMDAFDDFKYQYLMSRPVYETSDEELKIISQIRLYFQAAIRRAVGTDRHKFNERIILGGQIHQTVRSNTESLNDGTGRRGGVRGWLSNIF